MAYWTLDSLAPRERFPYWREVLCQAFTPLAADVDREKAFGHSGWVRSMPVSDTNGAEIASRSQVISHGPREVRRTDRHHIFVNVMLEGSCIVEQDGRCASIASGGYSVVDTTREYRQLYVEDSQRGRWRALSYRLPRESVIDQLFEPLASTAELHSAAQGGMAALALSTMLNVWRNAEQLDRRGMLAAETSLHAVLVAAMNKGTPHAERADRAARDAAMRAAVERHIEAGLQGRDLSATSTARAFSISVRKLHGLFEQADRSYAQTVKHMRVRACAEDLMSGTAGAMTDIALRWGFSDLSHLNRTFRSEYGCLPSALRRAAPRSSPSGSVIERQRG